MYAHVASFQHISSVFIALSILDLANYVATSENHHSVLEIRNFIGEVRCRIIMQFEYVPTFLGQLSICLNEYFDPLTFAVMSLILTF